VSFLTTSFMFPCFYGLIAFLFLLLLLFPSCARVDPYLPHLSCLFPVHDDTLRQRTRTHRLTPFIRSLLCLCLSYLGFNLFFLSIFVRDGRKKEMGGGNVVFLLGLSSTFPFLLSLSHYYYYYYSPRTNIHPSKVPYWKSMACCTRLLQLVPHFFFALLNKSL
jgi:hypothetical protein